MTNPNTKAEVPLDQAIRAFMCKVAGVPSIKGLHPVERSAGLAFLGAIRTPPAAVLSSPGVVRAYEADDGPPPSSPEEHIARIFTAVIDAIGGAA